MTSNLSEQEWCTLIIVWNKCWSTWSRADNICVCYLSLFHHIYKYPHFHMVKSQGFSSVCQNIKWLMGLWGKGPIMDMSAEAQSSTSMDHTASSEPCDMKKEEIWQLLEEKLWNGQYKSAISFENSNCLEVFKFSSWHILLDYNL